MSRSTSRPVSVALMVAGLSLVAAPLGATAHSGNLFTWAYSETADAYGMSKISTTNAVLTPLAPAPFEKYVAGADICNEVAWAVTDFEPSIVDSSALTWNHDTGVLGGTVALSANVADFPAADSVEVMDVWAADSLANCSKLIFARYEVTVDENTTLPLYVSYVDVMTGLTTPILEIPEVTGESLITWAGIATDPLTGLTHLFAQFQGQTQYSLLDIAGLEVSGLQPLNGVGELFDSSTIPAEADYQPDGKLWLMVGVSELEGYRLVSYAPSSDLTAAAPTYVGNPNEGTDPFYYDGDRVLTYDPEALAATGGAPLGLLIPGGVLFAAGLALVAVRRVGRTA